LVDWRVAVVPISETGNYPATHPQAIFIGLKGKGADIENVTPPDGFSVTKGLFLPTHKLGSHARIIHVQFGCTCFSLTSAKLEK
jgi:hypothetical protein